MNNKTINIRWELCIDSPDEPPWLIYRRSDGFDEVFETLTESKNAIWN